MKYIVELKYTNPSHEHVSLRRRLESTSRLVEAANEQEAVFRASRQQKALGFMIKEVKATAVQEATKRVDFMKFGKDILAQRLQEGFDTDPKDIAAYLVNRHGKGKVTMDHIEAYERGRDSHRPIEKNAVMQHVKKMSEEVEQIDEMDKSQPSSSRGAEGLATGNKATPVTSKKAAADALKLLKKKVNPVKEEVETVEEAKDVTKDLRTSMKMMDLRHGVDSDKRVSGYKMSAVIRAAQKKSDALSKVVKRPQAGTLAAVHKSMEREMQKESAEQTDESRIAGLLSAMSTADHNNKLAQMGKRHAAAMAADAEKQDKYSKKYPGGEKQKTKDKEAFMKRFAKEEVEIQYIEEKLTAADPASKWISDFVKSDNPKFADKNKKERIQMALGAHYAAKREKNEAVDPGKTKVVNKEVKTAEKEQNTVKGTKNKINMNPEIDAVKGMK
jgi:hypothetical protein